MLATQPICESNPNSGALKVNVVNNIGELTYEWSAIDGGANLFSNYIASSELANIPAGKYSVKVTDAGRTISVDDNTACILTDEITLVNQKNIEFVDKIENVEACAGNGNQVVVIVRLSGVGFDGKPLAEIKDRPICRIRSQ